MTEKTYREFQTNICSVSLKIEKSVKIAIFILKTLIFKSKQYVFIAFLLFSITKNIRTYFLFTFPIGNI